MARPKRILIVDDEAFNRELLESVVEMFGHESDTARDGQEALAKITPAIDLVLLDAMMPGMDGFEVARRTRENGEVAHIPIIMVTALTSKEDRLRAVEAGANDFVTKPLDRTELKVRMTSLLKMKEAQDAIKRNREELRARNALMQADLDLARSMQQAFIVKEYPCFPRQAKPSDSFLRFCHRYLPADSLGGDFFDVLPVSDTCAGVFICDVMGHGVRSALVTAMMRVLVGERAAVAHDPGQFLSAINRHLIEILERARTPLFASAFYLVADISTGHLTYANAGHPSPLRLRGGAGTVEPLFTVDNASGPALGVFPDAVYEPASCVLNPDDLFILFTDGLTEVNGAAENDSEPGNDEYGEARLVQAVRQHLELPTDGLFDAVLSDIRAFSATGAFQDDVCLLGMEVARVGC